jgi:hypothetical protein
MRKAFAFLVLALALMAAERARSYNQAAMDEGALIIRPVGPPDRIRPESPNWTRVIVDDVTGDKLSWPVDELVALQGEPHLLRQWRLDRGEQGKPPVYILTRKWEDPIPGSWPWDEGVEIVHAHADGFFPFEEALMPEDLPMDRIAVMMDVHNRRQSASGQYLASGLYYVDNRRAYGEKNREWARLRASLPFRTSNFDWNPAGEDTPVFFPVVGKAVYDAASRTVIGSDGNLLRTDNRDWYTGVDRSGVHARIHATWIDPSGRNQTPVVMLPLRGFRPGYGETRAVIIITERHSLARGEGTSSADGAIWPTGEQLADLINISVPIAAEHAGSMVVIDGRRRNTQWR